MEHALKKWAASSWNPVRIGGTALPANLLLLAKLILLCLFLFSEWRHFKVPFLPFVPVFDSLRSFEAFPAVLCGAFFFGAFLVFFNRSVRAGCLMVGLAVLVAILAGRIEYRNHSVIASFLLILIGLHDKQHGLALLRLQVAVIYFGAGLNKILDPDWLNGQFFEFWTHERLKHAPYMLAASYFPPMLLSRLFSWVTIFLEFSIALGFLIPRFYTVGVWLGIFLHSSIMVFTIESANLQGLFAYFFPVAAASYLVFFKWPETATRIQYDPRHRLSQWLKRVSRWIDPDRAFHWQPFARSLNEDRSGPYLEFQWNGRTYADFKAVKVFLLLNPLTYLVFYSGYLFLFRALPFAVGLIWDSRYIPFGAAIKVAYVFIPIAFFFPLFEKTIDSWLKRFAGSKPLPPTSAHAGQLQSRHPHRSAS